MQGVHRSIEYRIRGRPQQARTRRISLGASTDRPLTLRTGLLVTAAALLGLAIFLPLWRMTLVSVQYPEGLRMVVYPMEIRGDITEINLLNHYIGMQPISNGAFPELKLIPALFSVTAIACIGAAFVRRVRAAAIPLAFMIGTATYGSWSLWRRLYQFGHELDPRAAIDIEPFTPPMFGENVIAQFGSHASFSWGAFLPMIAGALVTAALWLDLRARRNATTARAR